MNEPERCLQEDNSKAQALGILDEQVQALGIVHAQALPTEENPNAPSSSFAITGPVTNGSDTTGLGFVRACEGGRERRVM